MMTTVGNSSSLSQIGATKSTVSYGPLQATRHGMQRCQHCGRQFNPHSAARHIPWCAKHQSESRRIKLTPEKLEALERYKYRINYRPSNHVGRSSKQQNHLMVTSGMNNRNISSNQTKNNNTNSTNGNNKRQYSRNMSSASTCSSNSNSLVSQRIDSNNRSILQKTKLHNDNDIHQPVANRLRATIARPVQSGPKYVGEQIGLRRSVSSITLVKHKGAIIGERDNNSNDNPCNGQQSAQSMCTNSHDPPIRFEDGYMKTGRAKSFSDLSTMSEVVLNLAKRMEEIYAQNERLLRSLASNRMDSNSFTNRKHLGNSDLNKLSDSGQDEDEDDGESNDQEVGEEEEVEEDDDGDRKYQDRQICNNCESRFHSNANFCHQCGSKITNSSSVSVQKSVSFKQRLQHLSSNHSVPSDSTTSGNLTFSSPTPPISSPDS